MLMRKKSELFKKPEWKGREFYTTSGNYLDRAQTPLFNTENSLRLISKEVEDSLIPRDFTGKPTYDKIFMPFVEDASTYWRGGIGEGCFNNHFAPYTVFLYVLKYHLDDLIQMIDGVMICNERDYNQVLYQWNQTYTRIMNGAGNGIINGHCSEDEMIRMGALFYQLMRSGDFRDGVLMDEERNFLNDWGGSSELIDIDRKSFEQYRSKLKGIYFSDMHWAQFCFRYANSTDENTFWQFNIPQPKEGPSPQKWFMMEDLIELIDFSQRLDARGGKTLFILKKGQDTVASLSKLYNFVYRGNRWRSITHNLIMETKIGENEDYISIRNYELQ